MSAINNQVLYSDFHKDLTRHPVSNDLARKINEDSVKESIKNLIFTNKGERPFQPQLGCDVRKLLFDLITPDTLYMVEQTIRDTLANYEPRANIVNVVAESTIDSNAISVTIVFNIINSEEEIVFTTILERDR